jgi:DNA-binding CsgD family transcriptional regulator
MGLKLVARQVHPLSARQYECLMLYGEGLTYIETAAELGLAYDTVKRHNEETRAKLGAKTLADAYRIVRRMQRNAHRD